MTSNDGFQFHPNAFRTIKFTPYWTTHPHKVVRWWSWTWWWFKDDDETNIIHHRQILSCPSYRIYDDFSRLLFLHARRQTSALTNKLPEESGQLSFHNEQSFFRFLWDTYLTNRKGSVGLILTKTSVMRIPVPLDLSSRSFTRIPCFIHSRRHTPLLVPSLVFPPSCSA